MAAASTKKQGCAEGLTESTAPGSFDGRSGKHRAAPLVAIADSKLSLALPQNAPAPHLLTSNNN